MSRLPRVVFVTGTDTDVGKTIVTAALAAALISRGRTVAVYKPAQAGTYDGGGDIDVVRRLAGVIDVHEGIRLPDPMAPVAAAARAGVALPAAADHVATIQRLAETHDHTLVEGAGGVLVQLDDAGRTLADIAVATATATAIATTGPAAAAVVVCRSGLGTLNHTELTLEALARRAITITGTIIGSWPREPADIDISNRHYLSVHATPLIGAVPEHAATLAPADFRASAQRWIPA
ncbi:MAG: dethiobiotin synthase [Trebonia sp.]